MKLFRSPPIFSLMLILFLTACPGGPVNPDLPLIKGTVWQDNNGDGQQSGEPGLTGWTIYLDANDNAQLDSTELSTTTNKDGNYQFSKVPEGNYTVRQIMRFGWQNVSGGAAPGAVTSLNIQAMRGNFAASQRKSHKQPRIVGGVDTSISDFPFMAAIGFRSDGTNSAAPPEGFYQFCGGALISDSWVLTAAHCSVDDAGNPSSPDQGPGLKLAVLLGTDTLSKANQATVVDVSRVIVHPDYQGTDPDGDGPRQGSVAEGYDIALWQLSQPVLLSGSIYTLDMLGPGDSPLTADDTFATAIGWGALASGKSGPDRLQVVHLPIVNPNTCFNANKDIFVIRNFETQICAGVPEGGIDSCQGDSGGPLIVRSADNDRWLHAGATSYGAGCAFPGLPGIYARTSVLSDWVKAQTLGVSRLHKITVTRNSSISDINFGNRPTTRPLVKSITPRWQTTNLTPDPANPAQDSVATFSWRILDEGNSSFSCSLDPDGALPGSATNVPCTKGENSFTTTTTFAEGVYLPRLTVTKGSTEQPREIALVVGNPVSDTKMGALSATDPADPDYLPEEYYVDYYDLDLTGVTPGQAVLLGLESSDFNTFITLYDQDTRIANGEGGILEEGLDQIIFTYDPAVNYLVGISSQLEREIGSYTLKTSTGTLAAFSF